MILFRNIYLALGVVTTAKFQGAAAQTPSTSSTATPTCPVEIDIEETTDLGELRHHGVLCIGSLYNDDYPSRVSRAMEECCAGDSNITVVPPDPGEESTLNGPSGCRQYCYITWPWPEDDKERVRALQAWDNCIEDHGIFDSGPVSDLICVSHPDVMPPPSLIDEMENDSGEGEDGENIGIRGQDIRWAWLLPCLGVSAVVAAA